MKKDDLKERADDDADAITVQADGDALELAGSEGYGQWITGKNERPVYPRVSRLRHEEGLVRVRVVLARNAVHPQTVELESGSGYEMLDRAALEKVKEWRFYPFDGAMDRLTMTLPFRFLLE